MATNVRTKSKQSVSKGRPVDGLASEDQRNQLNKMLKKRGIELSIESFRTNMRGNWYLKFRTTGRPNFKPKYDLNLTGFAGDVIDLGAGSWIVAGNATGNRTDGLALNMPFNIEYDAATDTLYWNLGELKAVIAAVSSPQSPVQMRADVTVPKITLVVRQPVPFEPRYRMLESSYLTI